MVCVGWYTTATLIIRQWTDRVQWLVLEVLEEVMNRVDPECEARFCRTWFLPEEEEYEEAEFRAGTGHVSWFRGFTEGKSLIK